MEQNTALGRRLSTSKYDRFSQSIPDALGFDNKEVVDEFGVRRNLSRRVQTSAGTASDKLQIRHTQSNRSTQSSSIRRQIIRKSQSGDPSNGGLRNLTPIPGSPHTTEYSVPPSPSSVSSKVNSSPGSPFKNKESINGRARSNGDHLTDSFHRTAGSSLTVRSQPQSLSAALELLATSEVDLVNSQRGSPSEASFGTLSSYKSAPIIPSIDIQSDSSSVRSLWDLSPPSFGQGPVKLNGNSLSASKIAARGISAPIPNHGMPLFRSLLHAYDTRSTLQQLQLK